MLIIAVPTETTINEQLIWGLWIEGTSLSCLVGELHAEDEIQRRLQYGARIQEVRKEDG